MPLFIGARQVRLARSLASARHLPYRGSPVVRVQFRSRVVMSAFMKTQLNWAFSTPALTPARNPTQICLTLSRSVLQAFPVNEELVPRSTRHTKSVEIDCQKTSFVMKKFLCFVRLRLNVVHGPERRKFRTVPTQFLDEFTKPPRRSPEISTSAQIRHSRPRRRFPINEERAPKWVEKHHLQKIPPDGESTEQILSVRVERDDIEDGIKDNGSCLLPCLKQHEKFLGHRRVHSLAIEFPRDTGKRVKMPLLIERKPQRARQRREDLFERVTLPPLLHTPVIVHADIGIHRHLVAPKARNASMPDK